MKLQASPVKNVTNFDGEEFEGSVSSENLPMILKLLIRNYNNPYSATIREWVSNASDSHKEAGTKEKILVTFPTALDPVFSVQDFGIGMSYEDFRNIYVSFLTSTKRKSNLGIGGFGIGGKSALALADQYNMVTIKDGLKNVFILERSETVGLNIKTVVRDEKTTEPNGVKVSVAVPSNYYNNVSDYSNILGGWSQDELEIQGGNFKSIVDSYIELENGYIPESFASVGRPRWGHNVRHSVLVGPVLYELPKEVMSSIADADYNFYRKIADYNFNLVLKLNIGDVTFPSSREVIEASEANIKIMVKKIKKLVKDFEAHIKEKLCNFSSLQEAWDFSRSDFARQYSLSVEYNNEDLTKLAVEPNRAFIVDEGGQNNSVKRIIEVTKKDNDLKLNFSKYPARDSIDCIIYLNEYDAKLSSETLKKYARETILANVKNGNSYYRRNNPNILFVAESENHPIHEIVAEKLFNFADLKTIPVPKKKSSTVKRTNAELKVIADGLSIPGMAKNKKFSDHEALKHSQPVAIAGSWDSHYAEIFKILFGEDRFINFLYKKDINIAVKAYPNIITLEEFLDNISKADFDAAKEKLQALYKTNVMLRYPTSRSLQELVESSKISKNYKEIITDDFLNFLKFGKQFISGYSTSSSTAHEKIIFSKFPRNLRYVQSNIQEFSLMSYRNNDSSENIEYFNWSLERYLKRKESK